MGDTQTPVVKVYGDSTGSNRNDCKRGWVSGDTSIIHMQQTILKVKMENGKVLSDIGLISRTTRLQNNFTQPICLLLGLP